MRPALWSVRAIQLCNGHPEYGLHCRLHCGDGPQTDRFQTPGE